MTTDHHEHRNCIRRFLCGGLVIAIIAVCAITGTAVPCYEDVVISNAAFEPANATYRFVDFFQYKPRYRRIHDDGTFYPPYENISWGGNRWIVMVGGTNRYIAHVDTPTPPKIEGGNGCPTPWLRVNCGTPGPITVTVRGGDPFTSLAGPTQTSLATGEAYAYAPAIPEGCSASGSFSFSIVNQPVWMSFDATTGTLSGVPTAADVGTYTGIQITAVDTEGNEVKTEVFAVDVADDAAPDESSDDLLPAVPESDPPSSSQTMTIATACPEGGPKAQEPDSTLSTANSMGAVPGTLCIEGRIAGNVDHFTFLAVSECMISILAAAPNGESIDLELMDSSGRPIGFLMGHIPPGRYYISLRASDRSEDFSYALQVVGSTWSGGCGKSTEPDSSLSTANPMGAIPGSLCTEGRIAGNVDHFAFSVASTCHVTVTVSATDGGIADLVLMDASGNSLGFLAGNLPPGQYYVSLRPGQESEDFNYTLHVKGETSSQACGQAIEPDYTLATANSMGAIPGSLCMKGRIAGNVDHFGFVVISACTVSVTALTPEGESADLELMSEDGTPLGFTAGELQPGRYVVSLRASDGSGDFEYTVQVTGTLTGGGISPPALACPAERLVVRGFTIDPTQDELGWATQHGLTHADTPKPDGATGDAIEWIERVWANADQFCIQTIAILEPALDCPAERAVLCNESYAPTAEELQWAAGLGLIYWDDGPKPLPEGTCGIEWIERFWGEYEGDENACTQSIDVFYPVPQVIVPADATVSGCVSVSSITPSETGTASVDDPCGTMVALEYMDETWHELGAALGEFHRHWRVTDLCGDTISAVQRIRIVPSHPYLTGSWAGTFTQGDLVVDSIYIRPQPPIFGNDQAHTLLIVAFAANTAEPPEQDVPVAQTATLTASVDGSHAGSATVSLLPGESGVRHEIRVDIPQVAGCHEVSLSMGGTTIYGCVFIHPIGDDPDF